MAPATLVTDADTQFLADNEGLIRVIIASFRRTYLITSHDLEDFSQIARMRLLRVPRPMRSNYNFLKVAIKNSITDAWRRRKTRQREITAGLFLDKSDADAHQTHTRTKGLRAQQPTIQAELEQEERDAQLYAALDALPDTERTVLRMWVGIAGPRRSVREISRILGHGQLWTKKRQVAGLNRLAVALEPHFGRTVKINESQKTVAHDCSMSMTV